MKEKLYKHLDEHVDEMIEIRRYLHANPELSFEEVKTAAFIAEYHHQLGHEVRTQVGGGGVVATLRGGKPGHTVALRADFDALPIHEETDVPYKSKVDGVMHACGHDGHTATLLVLAKVLNSLKEEIEGNIVFIHQHAEELSPGGAIGMIEDGCLDGVDVIFGTHLESTSPTGTISYRSGPIAAAEDEFIIEIQGRGGHGAGPHLTKDAIAIGSQFVVNLQQIISRRVDPIEPAVVSVCSIVAENANNVIADKVKVGGTVRTFNEKVRDQIEEEMERILRGTCIAADADYTLHYHRGYPATVNHQAETEFIAEFARTVPDVEVVKETQPGMGAEDFGYYMQHVGGTFFMTGAEDPAWKETFPHHHPKFNFDERAMLIAAKVLGGATIEYQFQTSNLERSTSN